MSREWLSVYVNLLDVPKYRRLSHLGRSALLHIWLLGTRQKAEAVWRDREALVEALDLDGYPPQALEELIERGWVDVLEDGRAVAHDWDEWQLQATEAIGRAWKAAGMREWRRHRAEVPPAPPSGGEDKTRHNRRDHAESRRDHAEPPNGEDMTAPPVCVRCGRERQSGEPMDAVFLDGAMRWVHRAPCGAPLAVVA